MRTRTIVIVALVVGLGAVLAAQRGRRVSGTVLSAATRRPVLGALVEYDERGREAQTTTTDATPPAVLQGAVVDAATQVGVDAAVTVRTEAVGSITSSSAETGPGGVFKLADLPGGPSILMVAAPGYAPYWSEMTLEGGKPRQTRVGLLLEAVVSGAVVDRGGEPVPAAWVAVGYEDEAGAFGRLESFAGGNRWTSAEGVFRMFGLIPNVPIALQAEGPDGDLSDVVTVEISPGMEQQDVVLTLP